MRWAIFLLSAASWGQGIPFNANGMVHSGSTGFLHYRTVTIDHTKVPSTQTNYPVLFRSPVGTVNTVTTAVTMATGDSFPTWLDAIDIAGTTYTFTRLTSSTGTLGSSAGTQTGAAYSGTPYLKTVANGGLLQNSSGFDAGLYTSSACTTKLDWEQATWSATTGVSEYYFREGSLSSSSDTVAYLCYDNSAITTDQSNKTGVWDSNFVSVYHFGQSAANTTVSDSTSNVNNGVANQNTSSISTTGFLGKAFSFNGSTDLVTGVSATYTDPFTLTWSAWINYPTDGGFNDIISLGANVIELRLAAAPTPDFEIGGVGLTGTNLSTGTWYYVAGVVTGGGSNNWLLYRNGALDATGTTTGSHSGTIIVGARATDHSSSFSGTIDEPRISNIARSANWFSVDFANQNTPFTFETVGSQI